MSVRRYTKNRIIPIKYYPFDSYFIKSRVNSRKSVVVPCLPVSDCNNIDETERVVYKDILGLIPDQTRKICQCGIPLRARTFVES